MASSRFQQRRIRRRLVAVHAELKQARVALEVAKEQLVAFADDAEEAHVRALVSENRLDAQSSSAATRHREVMQRAIEAAQRRVERLESHERELLAQVEI